MQILGIDRVQIAAPDADEAAERFDELLGIEFSEKGSSDIEHPDRPATPIEARISDFDLGPTALDIIGPGTDDPDNDMNKFLESRGPGLYGIIFRVGDIQEGIDELEEKGIEPIGTIFHEGFGEVLYHPKHFGGVLTLLVEYDAPHPSRTAWNG